jgi:hypothetical protein
MLLASTGSKVNVILSSLRFRRIRREIMMGNSKFYILNSQLSQPLVPAPIRESTGLQAKRINYV